MKAFVQGIVMATLVATSAVSETYKGYEMPPFQVVSRSAGYEVRDYAPHVLATVRVEGSLRASASAGFRKLAGYIFGGNSDGAKIAMTVPVAQVPAGDGFEISFMMPARYDLEALPKPRAGEIRFERTAPERVALSQFSGFATDSVLKRETARLRDALKRDSVTILDGPRYAYYDDPFTVPWRRRNEIAFVIAK